MTAYSSGALETAAATNSSSTTAHMQAETSAQSNSRWRKGRSEREVRERSHGQKRESRMKRELSVKEGTASSACSTKNCSPQLLGSSSQRAPMGTATYRMEAIDSTRNSSDGVSSAFTTSDTTACRCLRSEEHTSELH